MRKSALVLLAGFAVVVLSAAAADAQPTFDHLKCHKIKDPHKLKGTFDPSPALQPAFADQGCKIGRGKLFCAPVEKNNVQTKPAPQFPALGGQDLTNDFICYKIKCPSFPPDTAVTDQFASRTLFKMKAQLLCVPAVKGDATTTTTTTTVTVMTTTTSTTTTLPNTCQSSTPPQCGGPCPNPDDKCVPVPGTTICDCEPAATPCGLDPTVGICSGDCPVAGDVCRTFANGCDCVPYTPPCDLTAPQCNGPCPSADDVCVLDAAGFCFCDPVHDCEDPASPTGFPLCGGVCPPGAQCVPGLAQDCRCEPIDCQGTMPPQCGGLCPAGLVCTDVGTGQCVCG